MITLKTLTLWLLGWAIIGGLCFVSGWAWRDMRTVPEPTVRAIQMSLTVDGYNVGEIDDDPGPKFRAGYNRRKGDRSALRSYAKMPKE